MVVLPHLFLSEEDFTSGTRHFPDIWCLQRALILFDFLT